MVRHLPVLLFILFLSIPSKAQNIQFTHTGKYSGVYTQPLFLSTSSSDLKKPQLHYSFESLYQKSKSRLFQVAKLKDAKMTQKVESLTENERFVASKLTISNPLVRSSFKGNELKSWTPTDNSIAISKGGIIVSCVNYGIEYYNSDGTPLLSNATWSDFVNNNLLDQAKYDPRVIYDNKNDRFVVVLLHGFSSATSKILVGFSKSNNPLEGWNIYQMSGSPFSDTSWSDYPNIGLNDKDLFISLNRFGDAPDYKWKKTYMYQIGLNEGYNGQSLNYGLWNDIYTPKGEDAITLVAANEGLGNRLTNKMYFVQLMPDSGSYVYLYKLADTLGNPPTLSVAQYAVPHYEVCANAFEKNPSTGGIDSLSSSIAWAQNAFYLNGVVHYTHSADMGTGWCGISYGRIDINAGKADVTMYGGQGTDLCYPAVASFGEDSNSHEAMIAYLQSDISMTPQCGVIGVDKEMKWSAPRVIKTGDTMVNILYPPDYAIQPERWGDYTGICRRYNTTFPEVWTGAAYGANTPPRMASYGTWIAELVKYPSDRPNAEVQVYPNPMTEMFTLEFDNEMAGRITVQMFDVAGKLVYKLFDDQLKTSRNRLSFNALALPKGMYFIKVSRNGKALFSKKLTVRN